MFFFRQKKMCMIIKIIELYVLYTVVSMFTLQVETAVSLAMFRQTNLHVDLEEENDLYKAKKTIQLFTRLNIMLFFWEI